MKGHASGTEPQVQMGATASPQVQMGSTAMSFTGGSSALQMSASMVGGHAAACMQCNINWHCIKDPGHSGAHACAQGHSWW